MKHIRSTNLDTLCDLINDKENTVHEGAADALVNQGEQPARKHLSDFVLCAEAENTYLHIYMLDPYAHDTKINGDAENDASSSIVKHLDSKQQMQEQEQKSKKQKVEEEDCNISELPLVRKIELGFAKRVADIVLFDVFNSNFSTLRTYDVFATLHLEPEYDSETRYFRLFHPFFQIEIDMNYWGVSKFFKSFAKKSKWHDFTPVTIEGDKLNMQVTDN